MSDFDAFVPVTNEKELNDIRAELRSKPIEIFGISPDNSSFTFKVMQFDGVTLRLRRESGPLPTVKPGDRLELSFGLQDGHYLSNNQIISIEADGLTVEFARQIMRLQRRNSFRAAVGTSKQVSCTMLTDQKQKLFCRINDLSAGGIRILWPKEVQQPVEEERVYLNLAIAEYGDLQVTGIVRNVQVSSVSTSGLAQNETRVGLEFEGVRPAAQQTLVQLCMRLRRENKPVTP